MNKFNKKGFTLIEMLVVIAIIAVLVSIVVPTISSSTEKAKAATDAANLRSAKATITIGLLDGTIKTVDDAKAKAGIPDKSKLDDGAFGCTINAATGNGVGAEVKVFYGDATKDITYYANIAGGTASKST